jgi:hypothetical protein
VLYSPGKGGAPVLVNAGGGSVFQMNKYLTDDKVYFGLLRMGFGGGR